MGLILINLDAISLPWSFQSTFSSISTIFIDLDKCNCFVRSLCSVTSVSKILYLVLKNTAPVLSTSKAILFASSQKESSTVPLFNFTWTCYDIYQKYLYILKLKGRDQDLTWAVLFTSETYVWKKKSLKSTF